MRRRDFYRSRENGKVQEKLGQSKTSGKAAIESGAVEHKDHQPVQENVRILAALAAQIDAVPKVGMCKKCGKIIGRGRYFHERSCKGDNPRP